MQYQVSSNINTNKVFVVQRSELLGRIDVQYYQEHFDFSNSTQLSKHVTIQGGKRIPKGEGYSFEMTPYLYLRVADIDDNSSVDFSKLNCINEKVYRILERYEIHENEIAISIAGTIGKVFFVQGIPYGERIILTENCAKLVVRQENLLPEYLSIVLRTSVLQKQMMLNYIQTTIPKIGLDRIGKLMIPNIPDKEQQQQIINIYNSAAREKKDKEGQALKLLESIDDYLLGELGIKLPETKSQTLRNRIFTIKISEVCDGRMDPKSVLYFGEHAKSETYENVQLKQIATIAKGDSITSDQVNKSGQYPVIAGGQTSPYNHDQYNYMGNVITVSASGAYSGYVWYHDDPIFASDCSIIYSKDSQFLTKYIFEVLKAQQSHIYLLQQGAGQPHVYPDDLAKLWIPIVPSQKQQEIVAHVSQMRKQAKQLQAEGTEILQKAKMEVEKMILG